MNKPLEIKACGHINKHAPNNPMNWDEKNPNIEKFKCIIEEYAIIFFKSNNPLIDNSDELYIDITDNIYIIGNTPSYTPPTIVSPTSGGVGLERLEGRGVNKDTE